MLSYNQDHLFIFLFLSIEYLFFKHFVRNFIGARWLGFNDPQSGLARFVWWAGTTPGGKEVMVEREIHVTEMATALNVTPAMPVGRRIYVTVRAINRAGNNQSIINQN